jgi:long-chain acyl-CoA synthetase
VKNKFAAEEGFKKWLIDSSVDSKMTNAKENGDYSHTLYDSLVFSKIREGFGGKIRSLGTGSAPLSAETHAFMKVIFCCPLLEGYGQT